MIRFILFGLMIIFSNLTLAQEYATISLQRFDDKLVVSIKHDEGWHTYWKNPGDAGIASSFKFTDAQDKKLDPKAYEWPVPKKYLEAGDILTIGYGGVQHFFFDQMGPDIKAQVGVLICKDICIPGEAKLQLKAGENFTSNRAQVAYSKQELMEAFSQLPQEMSLPAGFEYYLTRAKGENLLTLHYSLKDVKNPKLPHELFLLTAFPAPPFGYKRETLYHDGSTLWGKMEIEWDGEYQVPPLPLPASGRFAQTYELPFLLNSPGSKRVEIIKLKISDFSLGTETLDKFYKNLSPQSPKQQGGGLTTSESGQTIWQIIFFAFLGGLILNLMPCVLPVISLKLFGLIKHQGLSQRQLFYHNLSYALGVVTTFMALALVVAGLKATGEEVGWGFQLQSPAFILVMMLILFILSLNLFGLFEFRTPGGQQLGNLKTQDGFSGDFFSGVLTTILSTPCSAPFLGTALTFAFTTSYSTIFGIFFCIGVGLASPFLMTALFPKTLLILPRPGMWMEKLKYFLGLSLVATIIWLYDVFVGLVHFEVISWRLNLLFVFWFFAFFFVKNISRHKILVFLVFATPLLLSIKALGDLELRPTTSSLAARDDSSWKPWSEEKLNQNMGSLIFMDFTAEWCLTCKVNKKLILETSGFEELAKKNNLLLLRADWTRRDDNITQYLKRFGAVGVPAYFVQKKSGEVIFLGETISLSKIEKALAP
jgi:thiol:disulfide interchange protein